MARSRKQDQVAKVSWVMSMETGSKTRRATFSATWARKCKSLIKVVSIITKNNKIKEPQKNSDLTSHTGRASIGRFLLLSFNQMHQVIKIKNGPRTSNKQAKMQQTKFYSLPPLISSLSNKTVKVTGQQYLAPKLSHRDSLTLLSITNIRVRQTICAIYRIAAS